MLANRKTVPNLVTTRRDSARDLEGSTEVRRCPAAAPAQPDLFANAAIGIFRSSPTGHYLEVNAALAHLYGYDSPQQLLDAVRDIGSQLYVQPEQRQRFCALLAAEGCVREFESEVYRRDGQRIWIAEHATAVRDERGKILYYEGFVTDITQRKRAELALRESEARYRAQAEELEQTLRALEAARAQLVESDKLSSLGELVAGLAHEINNPVNFVCGNLTPALDYARDLLALVDLYAEHYPLPPAAIADFIEDIDLDFLREDFPRTLTSMQLGTERISQLVLSLRNFARSSGDAVGSVDLHLGLDSTLAILQPRLKARGDFPGIKVTKDCGDFPAAIPGNSGRLNQVLMNLLGNAIDALEEVWEQGQRESLAIAIHAYRESDWGCISIRDNGTGMSPEVQARIFETFFTTKPVGKGTGLGLAISRDIVEQHGGQLLCTSTPGMGTEFVVRLPLEAVAT